MKIIKNIILTISLAPLFLSSSFASHGSQMCKANLNPKYSHFQCMDYLAEILVEKDLEIDAISKTIDIVDIVEQGNIIPIQLIEQLKACTSSSNSGILFAAQSIKTFNGLTPYKFCKSIKGPMTKQRECPKILGDLIKEKEAKIEALYATLAIKISELPSDIEIKIEEQPQFTCSNVKLIAPSAHQAVDNQAQVNQPGTYSNIKLIAPSAHQAVDNQAQVNQPGTCSAQPNIQEEDIVNIQNQLDELMAKFSTVLSLEDSTDTFSETQVEAVSKKIKKIDSIIDSFISIILSNNIPEGEGTSQNS